MITTGTPDVITFTLPPHRTAQLAASASLAGLSTADMAARLFSEALDGIAADARRAKPAPKPRNRKEVMA